MDVTSDRALATVERIASISPIPGADAIDVARVRGWDVVIRKGEFQVGDLCVYFEIDTMLDVEHPAFGFLANKGIRVDAEGHKGHVLRTVKLRGQLSQGLVLPTHVFYRELRSFLYPSPTDFGAKGDGITDDTAAFNAAIAAAETVAGRDVTSLLPVRRWEAPIHPSLSGKVLGARPSFVPKTDAERVQNLGDDWLALQDAIQWYATEKIDGTSVSYYWENWGADDARFGVCTRNLELAPGDTTPWLIAHRFGFPGFTRAALAELAGGNTNFKRVVVQGELHGEGIQKNPLAIRGHQLAVFAVIVDDRPLPRYDWGLDIDRLSVPILLVDEIAGAPLVDGSRFPRTVDHALAQADLTSPTNAGQAAEGIVWHRWDGTDRFKAISNRYLLKHPD